MRKIRALPNVIQFSVLALIIAAAALLLGPMKNVADRRAAAIRDQILARLETNLGIRISYDRISPALLSVVTIKDPVIEFEAGDFRAERIRVFYNPLKQLRGDRTDPARMISRIQVSTGHLNLVLVPAEGDEPDDDSGGSVNLDFLSFLEDKTLVLQDFTVNVGSPDFRIPDAEVERVEVRYDGTTVRFDTTTAGTMTLAGAPQLGELEFGIDSRGRFSPADMTLNGRFDILNAQTDIIGLQPAAFDVTWSNDELIVRRIGDEKPVDLSGSLSRDGWAFSGETRNLPISDLVTPAAGSAAYRSWFASTLDGEFSISGIPGEGRLAYEADVRLTGPPDSEPAGIRGIVKGRGNEDEASIDSLVVSTDMGQVTFSGRFLVDDLMPVGRLGLQVSDQFAGYPLSASFRTEYTNRTLVATPESVNAGDMRFESFSFLLIREEQVMTAALYAVPESEIESENRSILVDALLELGEEPVFHSFVSLEDIDGTIPVRLAGLTNADGIPLVEDTILDFHGFYESNRTSWVVNVEEASLRSRGNPDNGITFSGRVFPDRWAMDGLHLSWNDFSADGRVFAVSSDNGGNAEGKFLVGDRIIPVSGEWHTDGRMSISTGNGLDLSLGPRSRSGRSILLTAESTDIRLDQGELVADLDIRGVLVPGDWTVYVNQADVRMNRDDQATLFSTVGTVSPGQVSLTRVSITDEAGELLGNAVFDSSASGRFMNGRLALSSATGESYELTLVREQDEWYVDADVDSALLRRFSRERLGGTGNMDASLRGNLADPVVVVNLDSDSGILDGDPFVARASANLRSRKLRIQDLLFDHAGISLNRGIVLLDMDQGSLRSTADINTTFNQTEVGTGFSLALDLDREIRIDSLDTLARGDLSGTLATRPVLWDTREHLPAFTFHFSRRGGITEVLTPDRETLNLRYDAGSGDFDVRSLSPLPFVVSGGGRIKDDQLDLSFPKFGFDPQLINYVMVRDPILLEFHVVFQEGFFDGSLDIRGPSGDPDMFGTIRAVDLKVDTPYTYSAISPASTDIRFDGNRITVDRIEVPVGDGFVYGEGYLTLDRWSVSDFDMVYGGLPGNRSDGVPVYYPLLGINLDGLFVGEVNLTGDGQSYTLTGDLMFPVLKASLGAPRVPISQRKEGRIPTPFYLDLNLTTGNNVTFFLPNEQLKIVRATAAPAKTLNLKVTTVPRTLAMTGDLPVKSGNIYYFDRDFQMTDGAMIFNESLGDFDPVLSLRAETRVRDSNNEDVTVALVYDAPVKSDFNPTVETTPPRTDLEILELFGQAVVPYADSTESSGTTVLLATGSVFAQAGIVQPFEEVLREGLNLDMVTLQTDIIENTLAEGLDRGSESDTATLSSGLGRYLDNTSLFAGKYIGDALFLSGSVSANYFEEQRNRSIFGGLEFSTSVTLEMETPFFNVAWSYSPDPAVDRHFVEDNEISLRWQFSF